MKDYIKIEKRRKEIQDELDSQKTNGERNKLGQFATPSALADLIIEYLFQNKILLDKQIDFLDPAIGTGSFYSALIRHIKYEKRINSANGIEIDEDISRASSELWKESGLKIINNDFFALQHPIKKTEMPNLIITNPPYVRHHHISSSMKQKLKKIINHEFGYQISGLTGLYGYFILLSHFWLRENGYAVWLIPSEFMDVNYGKTIKEYLTTKVTLIHVHRFDPSDVQFNDALVSSVILFFQKKKPQRNHKILFTFGSNINQAKVSQSVPINLIKNHPKWTHFPGDLDVELSFNIENNLKLNNIFKITRGIATGDNNFFILKKKEAESLNLPEKFLIPILPPPRRLRNEIVESDGKGFPILAEKLVLISCNLPESKIKTDYPALYEYYKRGELNGITNRYLIKKRTPWYKQEHREPPPFICTYMGRNSRDNNPFRFIWNKSKAIATNGYLLLYPQKELRRKLDTHPEVYGEIFNFLQNLKPDNIIRNGRVYGGGLYKIEPKELGNISAEMILKELSHNGIELSNQFKLSDW